MAHFALRHSRTRLDLIAITILSTHTTDPTLKQELYSTALLPDVRVPDGRASSAKITFASIEDQSMESIFQKCSSGSDLIALLALLSIMGLVLVLHMLDKLNYYVR